MSNKNTFNSATKNAAEAVDALTKKTQTKIEKKSINLKLKKNLQPTKQDYLKSNNQ